MAMNLLKPLSIYLAHPISGLSADEVFAYYDRTTVMLSSLGYTVSSPMFGKDSLRCEMKFRSVGYEGNPATTNHSILRRDRWMVMSSDIVYVNLDKATAPSIGCVSELTWAYESDTTYSIVSMPKNGPHDHAFVLELADTIFPSSDEALNYLRMFIMRRNGFPLDKLPKL